MTSGFYGNDINLYLPVDKIYPNYNTAQSKVNEDEVFLGRYVLINYNFNDDGVQTEDVNIYNYNKSLDSLTQGEGFYHLDILRKSLTKDGNLYYATVGSLNLSKLANTEDSIINFNEGGLNKEKRHEESLANYDSIRLKVKLNGNGLNATQESQLILNIPELGNAISKMWDVVFDTESNGTRKTDLSRVGAYSKKSYSAETLAGCLGHCQRLLGYHCFYTDLDGSSLQTAREYSNSREGAVAYFWNSTSGDVTKIENGEETVILEFPLTEKGNGAGLLAAACEMILNCKTEFRNFMKDSEDSVTATVDRGNLAAKRLEDLLDTTGGRGINVGMIGTEVVSATQGEIFNSYEGAVPNAASGLASHAEGQNTTASNARAHAEGYGTIASGEDSHAEGNCTNASATGAHAEGIGKKEKDGEGAYIADSSFGAIGVASHVEGKFTHASGIGAHAEGVGSELQPDAYGAWGEASHVEGSNTTASNFAAHAEGGATVASGIASHAEGNATEATGEASHAGGLGTVANGDYQTVIGQFNKADKLKAFIIGNGDGDGIQERSNAFTVDWDGNAEFSGTVKSNGEPLGTVNYINDYTAARTGEALENAKVYTDQKISEASGTYLSKDSASSTYLSKADASSTYAKLNGGNTFNGNQTINGALAQGYSCIVNGDNAHAEGRFTSASGFGAHAEGNGDGESVRVTANGHGAHAEGYNSSATGAGAHAEGRSTVANGDCSHAEGQSSQTGAQAAHAEGSYTKAMAEGAHAEGRYTQATAEGAHAEGHMTKAIGNYSHAEGWGDYKDLPPDKTLKDLYNEYTKDISKGQFNTYDSLVKAFQETSFESPNKAIYAGYIVSVYLLYKNNYPNNPVLAQGVGSHAEGHMTSVIGSYSHAEGNKTTAIFGSSHIEGGSDFTFSEIFESIGIDQSKTIPNDDLILLQKAFLNNDQKGFSLSRGNYSHVEGYNNLGLGSNSHAEGNLTIARGTCSHAGGYNTIAYNYQTVVGYYNQDNTARIPTIGTNADDLIFIVGNGHNDGYRINAFSVGADSNCHAGSAAIPGDWTTNNADFAEYFEWEDGNLLDEDRRGLFVTLEGDKIRLANLNDDYILGVISSTGAFIGNFAKTEWQGKYLKDVFGETLTKEIEVPAEIITERKESINEETGEIIFEDIEIEKIPAHIINQPIINPDYDQNQDYISRKDRSEWDVVGLCGQVVVVDDGTCEVNGYCYPGQNGVGTKSDKGYRVMKRLDDTHIKVLIK